MTLLEKLSSEAEWLAFFRYKTEKQHLTPDEENDLKKYIDNREHLPVAERLLSGGYLGIPQKKQIRKTGTEKKRTVYVFPREENYALKLLTYLLLREYDGVFSQNLYSFRASSGVAEAMRRVLGMKNIGEKYTYKVDISNYFNSIDAEKMLSVLRSVFSGDEQLYGFFERTLRDRRVRVGDSVTEEEKGVMAGVPFAVFLANLYLSETDKEAHRRGIFYARYSDDIIVFADSEKERDEAAEFVRRSIKEAGLSVNTDKEMFTAPGESWSFLGIKYDSGEVDVSDISKEKLKAKIRRRARAIKRWQIRKNATDEQAVKAFIRAVNRKFFFSGQSSELTWARWYFPVITTDKSLHELDLYVQQWIRYVACGNHKKSNYSFTYEKMKELGYMSLVHEWFEYKKR